MRVLLGLTLVALLLSLGACARKHKLAHAENYAAAPSVYAASSSTPTEYRMEASDNWSPPEPPPDVVEQEAEARFQAASAKAESLGGIHLLTQADIEGLSYEQVRRLRGY